MSARWLASVQKMSIENAPKRRLVKPVANQNVLGALLKAKMSRVSFRLPRP
jgi:hypothetical protein